MGCRGVQGLRNRSEQTAVAVHQHRPEQHKHSVRLGRFELPTPALGERRKTRVKPRTCGNTRRQCRECKGYRVFTDLALTWSRRPPAPPDIRIRCHGRLTAALARSASSAWSTASSCPSLLGCCGGFERCATRETGLAKPRATTVSARRTDPVSALDALAWTGYPDARPD